MIIVKQEDVLSNMIDNGYVPGYNKDLKKADELTAKKFKSIKINYKHNRRAIPTPLTLSVFKFKYIT